MKRVFPPSFLFGTATAATQIEGHCTTSDWWHFATQPGRVKNGDLPHPACDAWHRFEQDIALQQDLSCNAHRMSLEWARIEPAPGQIDRGALDRYREMIGALRDASIEPMVTLLHFTLPRWVAQRGGLLSPSFPEAFDRFVQVAVEHLGDLVPRWVTINEPNVGASLGYLVGIFPPGRRDALQAWRAHEALIDAHVRAYRSIHEIAGRRGWTVEAGVAHHLRVVEPWDRSSPADRLGSHLFECVFNNAFPGALCGLPPSRTERALLALTGTKRREARDTHDFFGLNYNGRFRVRSHRKAQDGSFVLLEATPGAEVSDLGWEVLPEGFGHFLRTWARLSGRPVYVTENGIADARDVQRASFVVRHLAQVADALGDGVDVRGYFHWTLLDNFEWAEGYGPRFGLVEVDFASQARRLRPSADVFRRIATTREIDEALWEQHGSTPEQAWRAG
jgi:beta-glucosidase